MRSKRCEICGKREGVLNSCYRNSREDEYDEGDWVCQECEDELETNYECPCGCEGNTEICVYRNL